MQAVSPATVPLNSWPAVVAVDRAAAGAGAGAATKPKAAAEGGGIGGGKVGGVGWGRVGSGDGGGGDDIVNVDVIETPPPPASVALRIQKVVYFTCDKCNNDIL